VKYFSQTDYVEAGSSALNDPGSMERFLEMNFIFKLNGSIVADENGKKNERRNHRGGAKMRKTKRIFHGDGQLGKRLCRPSLPPPPIKSTRRPH
jgi:hypothetical protein